MPRVEIPEVVLLADADGLLTAADGASVQVNYRGGVNDGTAATVYEAATGSTTLTNPLTTSSGRIEGWLDEGSYNLVVSGTGITTYTQAFEARAAYPSGATDSQVLVWDAGNTTVKWVDSSALSSTLPWQIDINVFSTAATQTNFNTITQSSLHLMGGYRGTTAHQNAEVGWDVILAAGTWTITIGHAENTSYGIYTVSLDGSSVGTVDGYNASATSNVVDTITGVTVATTGKKRLLLKMATKNASSTNYDAVLYFVSLTRTA